MPISALSFELLLYMFELFIPEELLVLAQVSRYFNTVAIRLLFTNHILEGTLAMNTPNPSDLDLLTTALSLDMHYHGIHSILYTLARPMHDPHLSRELAHIELALSKLETRKKLKSITLDLTSATSTLLGAPPDIGEQIVVFRRLLDTVVQTAVAVCVRDGDATREILAHLSETPPLEDRREAKYHYSSYYGSIMNWCAHSSSAFLRSCFSGQDGQQEEDNDTSMRITPTQFTAFAIQSKMLLDGPLLSWTLTQLLNKRSLASLSFFDLDLAADTWPSILLRISLPSLQIFVIRNVPNLHCSDLSAFLARHARIRELSLGPGLAELDASSFLPLSALPRLTTLAASPEYIVRLLSQQEEDEEQQQLRHVAICIDLTGPTKQFRFQDIENRLLGARLARLTLSLRVHILNPIESLDLPLLGWPTNWSSSEIKSPAKGYKKLGRKHITLPTSGVMASSSTSSQVQHSHTIPTNATHSHSGPVAYARSPRSSTSSETRQIARKRSSLSMLLNPNSGPVLRRVQSIHLVFNSEKFSNNVWKILPRWLALFPALQAVVVDVGHSAGASAGVEYRQFGNDVVEKCVDVKSVKVNGVVVLQR